MDGAYWHFTCSHSAGLIGDPGTLRPWRGYVWLTDLRNPPRAAVGLTSHILGCDRLECRYRATDARDIRPWIEVRRSENPALVYVLENAPGAMPRHWYVSTAPVPVVRVAP